MPVALIRRVARHTLGSHRSYYPVNIVITDDKAILALSLKFMGEGRITDVLAFNIREPEDPPDVALGEVYVNADQAVRAAEQVGTDPETEIILYIVHGLLHLLGYEDETEEGRRKMWRKQRLVLEYFGYRLPEER